MMKVICHELEQSFRSRIEDIRSIVDREDFDAVFESEPDSPGYSLIRCAAVMEPCFGGITTRHLG